MSEILWMIMAITVGFLLGVLFYGGLYMTVKTGLTSKHPALIFSASFLLRTIVCLWGFLWVSEGKVLRILACLAGFITVRGISLYYERKSHLQEGRE